MIVVSSRLVLFTYISEFQGIRDQTYRYLGRQMTLLDLETSRRTGIPVA